ncbi:MAG TPA: FecR domain-containing protein, partial [Kofleriaceae bacterium]|nr:FecR domain-containing protein [Kofleriaceae bacterium]
MTNEELAALGRDLPDGAPTPARREAMRTSLIALAQNIAPAQPRRRSLVVGGIAAFAAAAGIALWLGVGATSPGAASLQRASVQAPEGARFVHTSTPVDEGGVDEVVRLDTGRVTVAVDKLRPRERFRVIAGDAEVEVRGTSFDVRVEDDVLMEVVVHTGAVEVRPVGRPTVLLHPGERWTREVAISDP